MHHDNAEAIVALHSPLGARAAPTTIGVQNSAGDGRDRCIFLRMSLTQQPLGRSF